MSVAQGTAQPLIEKVETDVWRFVEDGVCPLPQLLGWITRAPKTGGDGRQVHVARLPKG